MNIFFLSSDPCQAALEHVDKHVVKMVLESAQLLSTAHRLLDGVPQGKLRVLPGEAVVDGAIVNPRCYKQTHVNHPCAKWVRESSANYLWLYRLMVELDRERQHRFTPVMGKTLREHGGFLAHPPARLPDIGMTAQAQAMPAECKREDPVEAYKAYYREHKRHIAKWTKREVPSWYS